MVCTHLTVLFFTKLPFCFPLKMSVLFVVCFFFSYVHLGEGLTEQFQSGVHKLTQILTLQKVLFLPFLKKPITNHLFLFCENQGKLGKNEDRALLRTKKHV